MTFDKTPEEVWRALSTQAGLAPPPPPPPPPPGLPSFQPKEPPTPKSAPSQHSPPLAPTPKPAAAAAAAAAPAQPDAGRAAPMPPLPPPMPPPLAPTPAKTTGDARVEPMASTGLDFPEDSEGKRSTTGTNQGAFAASVKSFKGAHEAVVAEKKWRFGYVKHVVRQTQLAATSEEAALGIAKDGLEYLHSNMQFCRDGSSVPLKDAMKSIQASSFESKEILGSKKPGPRALEVPYKGSVLTGDALRAQVELWVRRGVIELDTGAALNLVAGSSDWLDLSDHTFVLFGAGSAMGPFPILMSLGAHVVAIDLPRPAIWKRLISVARDSPGKLTMPLTKKVSDSADDAELAECAGCATRLSSLQDLLMQTPEVRSWLKGVLSSSQRVVFGAYCYVDGPLFVRVSVAMDAIIADLVEELKVPPAIAYLCTPTDAHVCTASARDAAADALRKAPAWQGLLSRLLSFAKMGLAPNKVKTEDGALPVVDALVKEQGPNYCLAKRLQHWRAITARKKGCIVSSNIAPATATASVVSNKSFALAYKGMHHFKPMEVFQGETSNAVMLALLINDLRNPLSAGQPATALQNPMQLFAATAFHGGAWRTGWKFGTIGPCSAIAYITTGMLVKLWLVLYSVIQCLGWAYALLLLPGGPQNADEVIARFTYFQIAEVVHAVTGMVPSNPVTTAMQILSRVGLVQVVACATSSAAREKMLPWMTLFYYAWCITEVVRYTYYALNTFGVQVFPLTWLRYSTFLILYPLGVTGELGTVYSALPEMTDMAAKGPCGLACGTVAVASFRLGFTCLLGVYLLGFPLLFGTMLAQRKKVLRRSSVGTKKKSD
eukprot:s330_g2.t2